MTNTKSEEVRMLDRLIESAASGEKVVLKAKPIREVVKLKREDQDIDTVILSMEYSGTVNGEPFVFKKNYSFTDDEAQYALECLLIANNRLQIDYDRLKEPGIAIKREFFTFQNSFFGLSGDASAKRPALRLQNFIYLTRAGIPVSVDVALKCPDILLKVGDIEKKGFSCVAAFEFSTGEEKTTIEKLYGHGCYDDTEECQAEIREVANKRLERDCKRLTRAGMKADTLAF